MQPPKYTVTLTEVTLEIAKKLFNIVPFVYFTEITIRKRNTIQPVI